MDDIFCKSGRHILNGLAEVKCIEEILKDIPSGKIRKERDLISAALDNGLDDINRMPVRDTLELLDNLESKTEQPSHEVLKKVQQRSKDLAIVMSIPELDSYRLRSYCQRLEITVIFRLRPSSQNGVDLILEKMNLQVKRKNVE
jgi:hypothetical protein